MKTLVVASGQVAIDEAIKNFEGFKVLGTVQYRKELYEAVKFFKPDILLVGETLGGKEPLVAILMEISREFPNTRIIYLTGEIDLGDEVRVNSLGLLVLNGVYDIIQDKKITLQFLEYVLNNPKTFEDVSFLTKKMVDNQTRRSRNSQIKFVLPKSEGEEEYDCYPNLYMFSSIKPGSGKTFIATNVAIAIASQGVRTVDGRKPKVCLIETDYYNPSIATLLQVEEEKKNLNVALEEAKKIINEEGSLVGTRTQIEQVTESVLETFIPYGKYKNLFVLPCSQEAYTPDFLEGIREEHFTYILELAVDEFDVVIVDASSSLEHKFLKPLLYFSRYCFYVLNLDFNNVRNNARYRNYLDYLGVTPKIKYILNEDIVQDENEELPEGEEFLIFTAKQLAQSNFKTVAQIPMISKTIMLNSIYEGIPIILSEKKATEKARLELLRVANQLYPIKDFKSFDIEHKEKNKKPKKILFFLGR